MTRQEPISPTTSRCPTVTFNDYPKFGVWPDAYYMKE